MVARDANNRIRHDSIAAQRPLINPTTRAGVIELKEKLGAFNLADYKNDVVVMMNGMETVYNEIIEHGAKHEDFILNVFKALKMATDPVFLNYITCLEDNYQSGADMTADDVILNMYSTFSQSVLDFRMLREGKLLEDSSFGVHWW